MVKRVESLPLFELEGQWESPLVLPSGLTTRQRRTALKLQKIKLGLHPVTGLPLDPLAPKDTNGSRRLIQPHTCGSCVHRYRVPNIERSALACDLATTQRPTCNWYPACDQYKSKGAEK